MPLSSMAFAMPLNASASPWAFWISDGTLAALNAAFRYFGSSVLHRVELSVSGSTTPMPPLPSPEEVAVEWMPDPLSLVPLSSEPLSHAVSVTDVSRPAATSPISALRMGVRVLSGVDPDLRGGCREARQVSATAPRPQHRVWA